MKNQIGSLIEKAKMMRRNNSLRKVALSLSITNLVLVVIFAAILIIIRIEMKSVGESIREVQQALETEARKDKLVFLPRGLPDNFAELSIEEQTQAMSDLLDLPLRPEIGKRNVSWVWNDGEGLPPTEYKCPLGVICTLVLARPDHLFLGPGETFDVYVVTFQLECALTDEGC